MTPVDVAQYMLDQLNQTDYLYQEEIVYDIAQKFGDEFVVERDSGNLGIALAVLRQFNKLT